MFVPKSGVNHHVPSTIVKGMQHFPTPISCNLHFDVWVRLKVACMPLPRWFFGGNSNSSSNCNLSFSSTFQGLLAIDHPYPPMPGSLLAMGGPLVRATSRAPPSRPRRWRTAWSCWTTGARWCGGSPARSPTDACRGHGMRGGNPVLAKAVVGEAVLE